MSERSANEVPKQDPIASHQRVVALSQDARAIYKDLTAHASPYGSVVYRRFAHWIDEEPEAFYELLESGLIDIELTVICPLGLDYAEGVPSQRREAP